MAEARALIHRKSVGEELKDFFSSNTMNLAAGFLFLLLSIFVLWPIVVLLTKSIYGPDGLTFEYYIMCQ